MAYSQRLDVTSDGAWRVSLECHHKGHHLQLTGDLIPGLPSAVVEADLRRMHDQWRAMIDAAEAAQVLVGEEIGSWGATARVTRVDWTGTQQPVDFAFALFLEVEKSSGELATLLLYRALPPDDMREWLCVRLGPSWRPATERYEECPQCGSADLRLVSVEGHGVSEDIRYCYNRTYECPQCGWREESVCDGAELNEEERRAFAAGNRAERVRSAV